MTFCLCNNCMASPLSLAVGPRPYKEDYLQIFKCVSFWLHSFCGYWEGWDPVNRFNHTSWMAIVTPTDRPKTARNRCVIEVFGGVCVLSHCFWVFSVVVWAFVVWLIQISSFFSSDPRPVTMTSQPIRFFTNFMTWIPSLTFTESRVVSMEHLQRVWHVSRKRLSFRTPGSVPFWDLLIPLLFSRTCRSFSRLFILNIPRYTFSICSH